MPAPADGADLNPLLQDPGLAFHPPFLYLGYVGFSMAFSFAIAGLIEGQIDSVWARWVRPWTLAAWSALTVGIAMGSWWAYYELGWGGWWFWDPVENASLMPWLAGTALLHSIAVVEKRDALKSWTVLLAILTFSLSLMGTFLVRSGVLTSVHAFATDPTRGVFILSILALFIGGSLLLYAARANQLRPTGFFAPISREGALVLNNLLLACAAAIVMLGTLYPLFLDALGGGAVSVGPPYFNATVVPLMAPVLVAMAVGPMLAWRKADLAGALSRLKAALGIAALAAAATLAWRGEPVLAIAGMALGTWVIAASALELAQRIKLFAVPLGETVSRARGLPRNAYGMAMAHAGMGILVLGAVGASAWKTEAIQVQHPGESVAIAGYSITLEQVQPVEGPNYSAQRATFTVTRGGRPVARLTPENRDYPVRAMNTTESAIHFTGLADLYVVLGESDGKGGWTTRFTHQPLVAWIWFGATVMSLGGLVSLSARRTASRARLALAASAPA